MHTHPRKPLRTSRNRSASKSAHKISPVPESLRADGGGFLTLLLARIDWDGLNGLQGRRSPAGRQAYLLPRGQLLAALLFHYTVSWAGTLGEHLCWLLGIKMTESNLSERRQALPWTVFEELLARVLRPLACSKAEGSYRGLRLVGLDGSSFSLPNTESVLRQVKKGGHKKGRNPFAKLQCAALVELVWHNPLAARLGCKGESEWKLAQGVLDHLPKGCLLLADRLYGCAAFLVAAWQRLQTLGGHFLVRVKQGTKVLRQIKRLPDGSRLVQIGATDPDNPRRVIATLVVREIHAHLHRDGYRPVHLRLWTSLLDWKQAPAPELVQLYASRWEQELYFRELKRELQLHSLLQSQTPETAAQEVAAMIIGSSLIAEERSKLKPGQELSHRISFIKVWETLEPLWLTLLLGADILSEAQKQQLCDRFYALAATRAMPKRRTRSCPRVLRQPQQRWPKKRNQKTSTAPLEVTIVSAP